MAYNSWTHRVARWMVRPLASGPVTPNHLTTLRLLTALAACAAFAAGRYYWDVWGGVFWTISTFLDRADGELARVSGRTSIRGHYYDYAVDVLAQALFFFAIGFGQRNSSLGNFAIIAGLVAGTGVATAAILCEALDRRDASGRKAYPGTAGFDFDDLLYLFGPIAWLGGLGPLLLGSSLVGPAFALITWLRLRTITRSGQIAGIGE